jgi:hypothetical protein
MLHVDRDIPIPKKLNAWAMNVSHAGILRYVVLGKNGYVNPVEFHYVPYPNGY